MSLDKIKTYFSPGQPNRPIDGPIALVLVGAVMLTVYGVIELLVRIG